jgi:uncharacterized protein YndB with AHSA1/START domain
MKSNPIPEHGELTGPGEFRLVRLLPANIDRAWQYLVDSEKRGKWLASGPLEPRVGGRVELRFDHSTLTPHLETIPEKYREMCAREMLMRGTVTRCDAPRLLSYTWGEADGGASEVTFELSPRESKTLLVITHRKLDPKALTSVSAGWHTHVGILIDHLAGNTPQPFWSVHTRVEGEYEQRYAGR